ncbi:hypothetical protein MNEG_15897, partial [Monoraphidium neglectum]
MCVICADRAEAVAVGPCDHSEICHHCCLRLRILYRDARCPLCKADNATVYLTAAASSAPAATVAEGGAPQPQPQPHAPPPPPPPPPSFEELEAARARAPDRFYSGKRWALGVHVDKAMPDPPPALLAPGGGVAAAAALRAWQGRWRVPLHVQLLQWTSRSCPVCDPLGRNRRPFGTPKELREHLLTHGRVQCPVCVQAGRRFPLELEAHQIDDLPRHLARAHKHCAFCDEYYYGDDEMYDHMKRKHFHCGICQAAGTHHLYFA